MITNSDLNQNTIDLLSEVRFEYELQEEEKARQLQQKLREVVTDLHTLVRHDELKDRIYFRKITKYEILNFPKSRLLPKNYSKVLHRKLVSLTRDFQFTVTVLFLVPIPFLLLLISLHLFWLSPFIQNFSSSHEIVHCRFGIANELSFIVNSSLVLEELTYLSFS